MPAKSVRMEPLASRMTMAARGGKVNLACKLPVAAREREQGQRTRKCGADALSAGDFCTLKSVKAAPRLERRLHVKALRICAERTANFLVCSRHPCR